MTGSMPLNISIGAEQSMEKTRNKIQHLSSIGFGHGNANVAVLTQNNNNTKELNAEERIPLGVSVYYLQCSQQQYNRYVKNRPPKKRNYLLKNKKN